MVTGKSTATKGLKFDSKLEHISDVLAVVGRRRPLAHPQLMFMPSPGTFGARAGSFTDTGVVVASFALRRLINSCACFCLG